MLLKISCEMWYKYFANPEEVNISFVQLFTKCSCYGMNELHNLVFFCGHRCIGCSRSVNIFR